MAQRKLALHWLEEHCTMAYHRRVKIGGVRQERKLGLQAGRRHHGIAARILH